MTEHGPGQVAAQDLIARVPADAVAAHQRRAKAPKASASTTGARVALRRLGWPANVGYWLLARRKISDPEELAYYVCYAPAEHLAGRPWSGSRSCRWTGRGGLRAGQGRGRAGPLPSPPATRPGTGTSPWPWWRWRSWPSQRARLPDADDGLGGVIARDRAERAGRALSVARDASAAGLPGLALTGRPGVHAGLVDLAPTASGRALDGTHYQHNAENCGCSTRACFISLRSQRSMTASPALAPTRTHGRGGRAVRQLVKAFETPWRAG